jgi:hypothetical protein
MSLVAFAEGTEAPIDHAYPRAFGRWKIIGLQSPVLGHRDPPVLDFVFSQFGQKITS